MYLNFNSSSIGFLKSPRWKGVPFYLASGKGLNEKRSEIVVHFKSTAPCFCSIKHKNHDHQNTVTFSIAPKVGITIKFWAKKPDLQDDIEERVFAFDYEKSDGSKASAYEKVIYDAIQGQQLLFTSTDEVLAAWKFVTPILKNWKKVPLQFYAKGSTGPKDTIK